MSDPTESTGDLGEALRAVRLRLRPRVTLRDMGKRLGMSHQAYSRFEANERKPSAAKLGEIADALGVDLTAIEEERDRNGRGAAPTGLREKVNRWDMTIPVWGRVRAGQKGPAVYDLGEPEAVVQVSDIFGPNMGGLRIAGESMGRWGEPGELVIFDKARPPRRGHGCVVETKVGEYYVKLYDHQDGSTLFVKELAPEERVINFPLSEVEGVYAVRFRGD